MLKIIRYALYVCAALTMCSSQARAASIGPDCSTCQGSIYTLENLGKVADLYTADGASDTYQFKLTIDATNYNGGGIAIDEVAIKIASSTNKAVVVDAPGGAALWNTVGGGISADGCTGSGSGFECADWHLKTASVALVPQAVWSWTFNMK